MSNNVGLIKEINLLRKKIKDIQKGEGAQSGKPIDYSKIPARAKTAGVRVRSYSRGR